MIRVKALPYLFSVNSTETSLEGYDELNQRPKLIIDYLMERSQKKLKQLNSKKDENAAVSASVGGLSFSDRNNQPSLKFKSSDNLKVKIPRVALTKRSDQSQYSFKAKANQLRTLNAEVCADYKANPICSSLNQIKPKFVFSRNNNRNLQAKKVNLGLTTCVTLPSVTRVC